jgi:hypothetical protein
VLVVGKQILFYTVSQVMILAVEADVPGTGCSVSRFYQEIAQSRLLVDVRSIKLTIADQMGVDHITFFMTPSTGLIS